MSVKQLIITVENENQRLDNYLTKMLKGVPKTRIYKAIRTGEVRVNQKRAKPDYRLMSGDVLRIPPIRHAIRQKVHAPSKSLSEKIERSLILETPDYILVNKPAGVPVHGGTGVKTGLIEAIRQLRPQVKCLELVHRLDRDTSGCLLIAKKRTLLVELHHMLLHKKIKKHYLALLQGPWMQGDCLVQEPLLKNHLASGERFVVVSKEGKPSETLFRPIRRFAQATLVEAIPRTGRTHQIRVHAQAIGHPIAGDEKYGDKSFNKSIKSLGINRLFLHAVSLSCQLASKERIGLCVPLEPQLKRALDLLAKQKKSNEPLYKS